MKGMAPHLHLSNILYVFYNQAILIQLYNNNNNIFKKIIILNK